MCTGRLRDRVPCEFFAVARLAGHQLRFHKVSKKDGSSKGDAFQTGSAADEMWGVVFQIPATEKRELDRYEGRGFGYNDASVTVALENGDQLVAQTYVADKNSIDSALAPYSWYKAFVEEGAAEHGLPASYVAAFIASVESVTDPDKARHQQEMDRLAVWKRARIG